MDKPIRQLCDKPSDTVDRCPTSPFFHGKVSEKPSDKVSYVLRKTGDR
jgi:hypothetical protein